MVKVTRHLYNPIYEGFCSGCGSKLIVRINDKYPRGIDRKICSFCNKESNIKFFPNDNGVMILELIEIGKG